MHFGEARLEGDVGEWLWKGEGRGLSGSSFDFGEATLEDARASRLVQRSVHSSCQIAVGGRSTAVLVDGFIPSCLVLQPNTS